jgi:hypothetical protein
MPTEAPPRGAPAEPYDTNALAAEMEAIMKQSAAPAETAPVTEPEPATTEPEITTTGPELPETPETELEATPEEPTAETSNEDEMAAIQKKVEEDAAAAEVAKKAATPPKPEPVKPEIKERDKDLTVAPEAAAHLHPKTRKLIQARNELVISAREERDRIAAEKAELQAKLAVAEEAAKKITVPKEVETELSTLRERVRELDITRDPAIETKYDKPVQQNNERVIEILKQFGADKRMDGDKVVDAPEQLAALVKAGITFRTMQPLITKLEGLPDGAGVEAAENIREAIRQNNRLALEKQNEIAAWKTNYDAKRQTLTANQQQQQEQLQTQLKTTAEKVYESEIAELAKTVPFLSKPAAALPTDTPAVAAQKQKALADYEATTAKVQEAVKAFVTDGKTPEKVVEAQGRLMASAVQGIRFKLDVIPKLNTMLQVRDARIKELEAQLGKVRTAGTLNRSHSASVAAPAGAQKALPQDNMDAATQIAREMGISV